MAADYDRNDVSKLLAGMVDPVRLIFFTQTLECETCLPTRQILDEVVAASDLVTLEEYNVLLDKEQVAAYGVTRPPTVAVVGATDVGIRFVGVPAGHEFRSLIDAILMVSTGESGLSDAARELVRGIDRPTAIQVFVTPT